MEGVSSYLRKQVKDGEVKQGQEGHQQKCTNQHSATVGSWAWFWVDLWETAGHT